MKKRLSLFLTALLTMAVLGGCGADSTGESSQENSSKESVVQSEAVYGGSVAACNKFIYHVLVQCITDSLTYSHIIQRLFRIV